MDRLLPYLLMAGLLALGSCDGNKDAGNQPPPFRDTIAAGKDNPIIDPGDLEPLLADSAAKPFLFRAQEVAGRIFGEEYGKDKLDDMERSPRFPESKQSYFAKYLKKEYIKNEYGSKIFPRLIFKAWEFPDQATSDLSLTAWLNGHEASSDHIELGDEVEALKSPPFVCAVAGSEIYMIKSACVYSGDSWSAITGAFFNEFKGKAARHLFEVECGAGRLTYK